MKRPTHKQTIKTHSQLAGSKDVHYPGQDPSEKTLLVIKKHWWYLMPAFMMTVVLLLLALTSIFAAFSSSTLETSVKILIFIIGVALVIISIAINFVSIWIYNRSIVVITTENIVEMEQKGLFHSSIATLRLVNIQDVKAEKRGLVQTSFDYGTIVIQTAAEAPNFIFDYVTHPYQIKQYIIDLHDKDINNN